jgi:hypothetical protein
LRAARFPLFLFLFAMILSDVAEARRFPIPTHRAPLRTTIGRTILHDGARCHRGVVQTACDVEVQAPRISRSRLC